MRKCILHIGTHKTGTTSIQLLLSRERAALKSAGYLFPITGRVGIPPEMVDSVLGPESIDNAGGHHNIAWRLLGDARFRSEFGTLAELYREIEDSSEHIILSSEDFIYCVLLRREEFRSFAATLQSMGLQLSVVVYFRNQADFVRSIYMEVLKHKAKSSFNDFLNTVLKSPTERLFDYDSVLTNLESVTGLEIVARAYDPVAADVVGDFNSILGFAPQEPDFYAKLRVNHELPIADSFTLFYENRHERAATPIEKEIIASIFSLMPQRKLSASGRARTKILEASRPYAGKLLNGYGFAPFDEPTQASNDADDPFVLDRIFSAEAAYFVNDLGRKLALPLQAASAERDALRDERDALARVHQEVVASHQGSTHAQSLLTAERDSLAHLRDDLLAERDALISSRHGIMLERDAVAHARDEVLAERDALVQSRDQVAAERDALVQSRNQLTAERNALAQSHDQLSEEHNALARSHDRLMEERNALARTHEQVAADRDVLLSSRSWRVTVPLRNLNTWLGRRSRGRS